MYNECDSLTSGQGWRAVKINQPINQSKLILHIMKLIYDEACFYD